MAVRRLRDIPIGQKLVVIAMITSAAALLAAGALIVAADSVLFRGYLRRDLSALAQIVADNSTAALAFTDAESAGQTLGALHARTHVIGACIFDSHGVIFATWSRARGFVCPAPRDRAGIEDSRGLMTISQPVVLKGQRIGTLVFAYDLGEIGDRIALYGATVVVVLLASAGLAFLLSSGLRVVVARPIDSLVRATTAVSRTGDYRIRAEKLSGDELGLLVDRFNEMLARIEQRDTDLERALKGREAALRDVEKERERFSFMAESMPQKIFTAKPNGDIDYLNAQWMEFTGLPFEQMRDWGWTQFVHPEDVEENVRLWRHSIETGRPFLFEHRFRRADGAWRWHLSRAHAMRDVSGGIIMWIGSNTEIHDQKEREAELRRANRDLEQFAWSASHDLQEPIRNVAVYSEIVAMRYGAAVDEEGRQFLEFIREGGRRLAVLVGDLLAYTRASMAELTRAPVDSTAVLRDSVAGMSGAMRDASAEVTWDTLPKVHMGEAHMLQVFHNLISNAIKYRSGEPPRVHVSAVETGDHWRFSVRDNGIGIDPKYKERIFGLFKRLHHDRSYGGTGIGLAICQRIVERYGGRIWVESEPGRGSVFYFTIPREPGPAVSTLASVVV